MNRVVIILDESLSPGEAANVAAITMGQISRNDKKLYFDSGIIDKSGFCHSGIKCNVIILKSNRTKLYDFCLEQRDCAYYNHIKMVVFSQKGKLLNNQFNEYAEIVSESNLLELLPIAVGIAGNENIVKMLTKKFSLF